MKSSALPEAFLERMRHLLGGEFEQYCETYERSPRRGLRVNLLKCDPDYFLASAPFVLERHRFRPRVFMWKGKREDGIRGTMRAYITCRSPRRWQR